MSHKLGVALVFCVMALSAPAMSETTGGSKSNYCGSGGFLLRMDSTEETIRQVYNKCAIGDIIFIPGNSTMAIGRICDFSKDIYREPDGLAVCVIGTLKPTK